MTLVYLIFGIWVVFGAYFAGWAIRMRSEWKAVESCSSGVRLRIPFTSPDRWLHEIEAPRRERVAAFIQGLRWRYSLFFFVLPGALFVALWLSL